LRTLKGAGDLTDSNGVVLIYVPCGSEDEALLVCRALLEERLVACGNIHQTRSVYRWKGEVTDEQEYVLICKTTRDRAFAAFRRARALHSYEVPCVLRIEPAEANYEYAAWVRSELSGHGDKVVANLPGPAGSPAGSGA
jgi:periplasmic divalent cation tolerance protein